MEAREIPLEDRKPLTISEADKVEVRCDDCNKMVFLYETDLTESIEGSQRARACAECFAKNWRTCCLCNSVLRIKSYNPNLREDFAVNAIYRDNEMLEDGTYLDYMCADCVFKLKPALDFFIGADKEMIRKCREFFSD